MIPKASKVDDEQRAGLRAIVRACAEQHKADVVLHALEVACAANAIGVERPCEEPDADAG